MSAGKNILVPQIQGCQTRQYISLFKLVLESKEIFLSFTTCEQELWPCLERFQWFLCSSVKLTIQYFTLQQMQGNLDIFLLQLRIRVLKYTSSTMIEKSVFRGVWNPVFETTCYQLKGNQIKIFKPLPA